VGRLGDAFLVASETCAFDIVEAEYICDVNPGEVLVFDRESLKTREAKSFRLKGQGGTPGHCIFEYVYFSRPDSTIFNESVDKVRRKLGKALAREHPTIKDNGDEKVVVINVPDSSNTATLLRFGSLKLGTTRNMKSASSGVTTSDAPSFQPAGCGSRRSDQFNTVKGVLGTRSWCRGRSIVRGTTSEQLVN
jgi:amidophosphoribosyltransferase